MKVNLKIVGQSLEIYLEILYFSNIKRLPDEHLWGDAKNEDNVSNSLQCGWCCILYNLWVKLVFSTPTTHPPPSNRTGSDDVR